MLDIQEAFRVVLPGVTGQIVASTFAAPDQWWYPAQMARCLGVTRSTVQRAIESLAEAGVLESRASSSGDDRNQFHYRADRQSAVFPGLVELVWRTVGVPALVDHILQTHRKHIQTAHLFGYDIIDRYWHLAVLLREGTSTGDKADLQNDIVSRLVRGMLAQRAGNTVVYEIDDFMSSTSWENKVAAAYVIPDCRRVTGIPKISRNPSDLPLQ